MTVDRRARLRRGVGSLALTIALSSVAFAKPVRWETHVDARGFSCSIPRGWTLTSVDTSATHPEAPVIRYTATPKLSAGSGTLDFIAIDKKHDSPDETGDVIHTMPQYYYRAPMADGWRCDERTIDTMAASSCRKIVGEYLIVLSLSAATDVYARLGGVTQLNVAATKLKGFPPK